MIFKEKNHDSQGKNRHFLLKNRHFLLKNRHFLLKNHHFLLKNCHFLLKNHHFLLKNHSFLYENAPNPPEHWMQICCPSCTRASAAQCSRIMPEPGATTPLTKPAVVMAELVPGSLAPMTQVCEACFGSQHCALPT